jgi:hypothetical protein
VVRQIHPHGPPRGLERVRPVLHALGLPLRHLLDDVLLALGDGRRVLRVGAVREFALGNPRQRHRLRDSAAELAVPALGLGQPLVRPVSAVTTVTDPAE